MSRQAELAGMERPNGDKELDALAEAFKKSSKKRKNSQDAELEARSSLIESMKKKKLTVYEDKNANPPLLVTLRAGEDKITVKAIDEVEPDDEDGDEPEPVSDGDQSAKKKRGSSAEA